MILINRTKDNVTIEGLGRGETFHTNYDGIHRLGIALTIM